MALYAILLDGTDFVKAGSYVVQGERFQNIGNLKEAKLFKTERAAENYLNRLVRANLNGATIVKVTAD